MPMLLTILYNYSSMDGFETYGITQIDKICKLTNIFL